MSNGSKNALEWSVFTVSSILVLSVLGYLAYDVWAATAAPPALDVQLGQIELSTGRYAIPVTVHNRGQTTAESVHIEVTLERDHGGEERADFEIPFVPRQSSRRGYVVFDADPRTAKRITARALGYNTP